MGSIPFQNAAQRGKWGEQVSARYLRQKGYKILACGFHTRQGELDIVAERRNTVVVVEVKTRSDFDFARGIEAVAGNKMNRIRAATEAFMAQREDDRPVRFDCIEVVPGQYFDDPPKEIIHHEDIYMDLN